MKIFLTLLLSFYTTTCYADITTGLKGWWRFDDNTGTSAADSSGPVSGRSSPGALTGPPAWTGGFLGYGLDFNGTSHYVTITNDAVYRPANALTVAAWIKGSSIQNSQYAQIVANGSDATTGYNLYLQFLVSNQIAFIVADPDSGSWGNCYALSDVPGNDNKWHHVAGVYAGTSIKVYVDGVLKNTDPCANSGISYGGNPVMTIGRKPTGNYFTGIIDDVRVYNVALSDADILQLYNTRAMVFNNARFNNFRINNQ